MNRATLLSLLESHRDEVKRRFAIKRLSVFGSAARDEMHDGSDIDLLVKFDGPATFDNYMGLLDYLEALLHARIDLATDAMIKPRLRSRVEKDMIHVA
ncbi:MAG: DNA polymerase subunit beta [Rhodospirillales bacterium RIFCSPLOWO2_12_FULL_58_28]|nr:MAG: DNA polymerase subunit beta [Rhodospirillales bacterium RIFCSPLOWO2_02_FULL_58_16]OHC78982.1 MAG: DNA polymerase subunit beta [Rhodospirillales bacterium RIFCSPLOWO2_12_FULL_58_28]